MKKKILSWMLILCMVVTLMPLMGTKVEAATTPSGVSESTVKNRINQLSNALSGKYFTTDGVMCKGKDHTYYPLHSHCTVANVMSKNKTVRNLVKADKGAYNASSSSNLPCHYYNGSSLVGGDSCCGFANFAEWYLFSNKYTDKVTTKQLVSGVAYNYTNMKKYAKPGDVLRLKGEHSAIVVSVGSTGVKVLQANWGGNDRNIVSVNTIRYSDYYGGTSTTISRAKNYSQSWAYSLNIKNATSGKPYLTWSSRTSAVKYKIYRKKSSESSYKLVSTTSNKYYTDNSATPSYLYYYYVKAINKSGKTLQTTYAVKRTCDLAQPKLTGISNVASHGGIKISFKGVKNANRYELYRATSAKGTYEYLFNVDCKMDSGGESHYFINSGGTPGKTYYYKVKAINTSNVGANSALSGYKYRTRDLARPVITVNAAPDGKPVISWNPVSCADKYEVYRAPKGASYSKIATVTGTSVTNTKTLQMVKCIIIK